MPRVPKSSPRPSEISKALEDKHYTINIEISSTSTILHASKIPELMINLPKGLILDGELIQADKNGKPDFEAMMNRFMITNNTQINHLSRTKPVTFCAFDVIKFNGCNVTQLPLTKRKELLNTLEDN